MILDGEAAWDSASSVAYYVFDILWLEGRSVMPLPLDARRALLKDLPLRAPLAHVPEMTDSKPWERACSEGWEGVIAKRAASVYVHQRSMDWLKFKCENEQELVIVGYTEPSGQRVGIGALLVGYYERQKLLYAGKVGTGFDTQTLRDLEKKLSRIQRSTPPVAADSLPKTGVHWVEPRYVAQIAFTEWTGSGKLRHPRYVGLRTDKKSSEVVRE